MCFGIYYLLNWSFGMSILIFYSIIYSGWIVVDYLVDWLVYFGDVNYCLG